MGAVVSNFTDAERLLSVSAGRTVTVIERLLALPAAGPADDEPPEG
jgi:hypothetical protein